MRADEFFGHIKTQRPDRKYLYWDDEHRMMLEITRTICDSEIYYNIDYGPFNSFGVNNWVKGSMSEYHVFGGYYHEYKNGHVTSEDYFMLDVRSLIPKGMEIEPGDAVAPAGEEYEKSEKDAMWERDRMGWHEDTLAWMQAHPGEWSAAEIAEAIRPGLTGFRKDHARGAVYHALSTGMKYRFFEKIGEGKNVKWRCA